MRSGPAHQYVAEHGAPEQVPDLPGRYPVPDGGEELYGGGLLDRSAALLDAYFEPRDWERRERDWLAEAPVVGGYFEDGLVYEVAAPQWVKRAVPTWGSWWNRAMGAVGYDRPVADAASTEQGLFDWEPRTRSFEAVHGLLVPGAPAALAAATPATPEEALAETAGLTAVNLYAVLLQRYNRARIHNHLDEHAPGWRDEPLLTGQLEE